MRNSFYDFNFPGTGDENPNEKFINALGDSEEARKELKQTADHIVLILNDYPGPFRWAVRCHAVRYSIIYIMQSTQQTIP